QGAGSTEARVAGFSGAAASLGLEVLADPYPDTGTIEGCKTAAANTLEGFIENGKLELDGIFACNLYSTLGVSAALMDLQNSGVEVQHVRFVGFDTSTALIRAVEEGRIDALIAQNPKRMGALAVQTLYKVVNGESVPPVIDTGITIVTQDTLSTP
ncbi:MAG: substrate-binding domain-containing protein, partial [Kiritimatiellia bacterium]